MPRFSISQIKSGFSKEKRQARQEARLQSQLSKEQRKYEKYSAHKTESERISKLKKEIESYRTMRGQKKRKVNIGGHTFSI